MWSIWFLKKEIEERNVECEKFNRLQDIFGLDIAGDGLMSELLFY